MIISEDAANHTPGDLKKEKQTLKYQEQEKDPFYFY